jgi:hypothetical protein
MRAAWTAAYELIATVMKRSLPQDPKPPLRLA